MINHSNFQTFDRITVVLRNHATVEWLNRKGDRSKTHANYCIYVIAISRDEFEELILTSPENHPFGIRESDVLNSIKEVGVVLHQTFVK